ncbi:unknown protein [Desulfotalea psychrophila LSv54]|uniref:Uncharacterized protein n=1 Tax=Desulfotalea psychrophila (strain LSv54 / DSM 12343) TaxID=177439 RepID=Q6ALX9_DESPS|nr:unknown protein [Desulfotalea psychrophila LSv54]
MPNVYSLNNLSLLEFPLKNDGVATGAFLTAYFSQSSVRSVLSVISVVNVFPRPFLVSRISYLPPTIPLRFTAVFSPCPL